VGSDATQCAATLLEFARAGNVVELPGQLGCGMLPLQSLFQFERMMQALVRGLFAWLFFWPCYAGAQSAAPFPLSEIAPGNFVHYGSLEERSTANLGDNANIGFIVGSKCVAVIDTGGSFAVGERLRAALRVRTALPVCYVITTHAHPDHFFGAAAFRAEHPVFAGHQNLPRALQQRAKFYLNTLTRDLQDLARGSEVIEPTLLVKDRMELDLGERTIVLTAWPTAHTDNDLTVADASTGTLWAGDLLFVQHTPVLDGSITGFLSVIDALERLAPAHFVAGHGQARNGWVEALAAQKRYFQVIADETRRALKSRRTLQDAIDTVGLIEEPNWVNFELFHRRNVTAAYTELEWED
jgi:quinoprotein relay system zinc metallohydrolase 2